MIALFLLQRTDGHHRAGAKDRVQVRICLHNTFHLPLCAGTAAVVHTANVYHFKIRMIGNILFKAFHAAIVGRLLLVSRNHSNFCSGFRRHLRPQRFRRDFSNQGIIRTDIRHPNRCIDFFVQINGFDALFPRVHHVFLRRHSVTRRHSQCIRRRIYGVLYHIQLCIGIAFLLRI